MASDANLGWFLADMLHRLAVHLPMVETMRPEPPKKGGYNSYVTTLQNWCPRANINHLLTDFATEELDVLALGVDLGQHTRYQAMSHLVECLESVDGRLGPTVTNHIYSHISQEEWRKWKKIIPIWVEFWDVMKEIRHEVYSTVPYHFPRGIVRAAFHFPDAFWTLFWEYASFPDHDPNNEHLKLIAVLCTEVIPQTLQHMQAQSRQAATAFMNKGQSILDTYLEHLKATDPLHLQFSLMAEGMQMAIRKTKFLVRKEYQPYLSGKPPSPDEPVVGRRLRTR